MNQDYICIAFRLCIPAGWGRKRKEGGIIFKARGFL